MRPNRGTFAIRSRGILSGFFASAALMGAFGCALAVVGSGGGGPVPWPEQTGAAAQGGALRLVRGAPTPTAQPLAVLPVPAPGGAAAPAVAARPHAAAPRTARAPRIAAQRETTAVPPLSPAPASAVPSPSGEPAPAPQ